MILRKINEEKEKKFNIQLKSLKEENNNLKQLEKEREKQLNQEKYLITKLNETMSKQLEVNNNEKQMLLTQISCLKEMAEEKEKLIQAKEQQLLLEIYQKKI